MLSVGGPVFFYSQFSVSGISQILGQVFVEHRSLQLNTSVNKGVVWTERGGKNCSLAFPPQFIAKKGLLSLAGETSEKRRILNCTYLITLALAPA